MDKTQIINDAISQTDTLHEGQNKKEKDLETNSRPDESTKYYLNDLSVREKQRINQETTKEKY